MTIIYGARELAHSYRTVRGNTLRIAEEIPEEHYGFSPAPGTRTVAALLVHIALITKFHEDVHRDKRLSSLEGYDFGGLMGRGFAEETKPRTKAEIIGLLRTEGDAFAAWLETLGHDFLNEIYTDPTGQNPRTRFENILGAKEHEMHHRGQLMVIQRMLGIVPHLTRAMQERIAARAAAANGSASP
jgi:uncharacterized damage-inducible protein DinB